MNEEDIKQVAEFLHRAVQLSLQIQKKAKSKLLKDFVRVATESSDVRQLNEDVGAFSRKFPLPGVDVSTLTKPEGLVD